MPVPPRPPNAAPPSPTESSSTYAACTTAPTPDYGPPTHAAPTSLRTQDFRMTTNHHDTPGKITRWVGRSTKQVWPTPEHRVEKFKEPHQFGTVDENAWATCGRAAAQGSLQDGDAALVEVATQTHQSGGAVQVLDVGVKHVAAPSVRSGWTRCGRPGTQVAPRVREVGHCAGAGGVHAPAAGSPRSAVSVCRSPRTGSGSQADASRCRRSASGRR